MKRRLISLLLVLTMLFSIADTGVYAIKPVSGAMEAIELSRLAINSQIRINSSGFNGWTDANQWYISNSHVHNPADTINAFNSLANASANEVFGNQARGVRGAALTNSTLQIDNPDAHEQWETVDLHFAETFKTVMTGIQYFQTIVGFIGTINSFLHMAGLIEDGPSAEEVHLTQAIALLQETVDRMDVRLTQMADSMISGFTDMDIKFDQQAFEHYRDTVWTVSFLPTVREMESLQSQYTGAVMRKMMAYAKSWQGGLDLYPNDLRMLFHENEDGEITQVYVGNNLAGPGTVLGPCPKVITTGPEDAKIETPVSFSITVPGYLIHKHIDNTVLMTKSNCEEEMLKAFRGAIKEAIQTQRLKAYCGFYTDWSKLTEEQKETYYEKLAQDMLDAVSYAASFEVANDEITPYVDKVLTEYRVYAKKILGENGQVTPMEAQYQMLALTHCFEGEVEWDIVGINQYMTMMNAQFGIFAGVVAAMGAGYEKETAEVQELLSKTTLAIDEAYENFFTGNPNYCYQVGAPLEYKELSYRSAVTTAMSANKSSSGGVIWDMSNYGIGFERMWNSEFMLVDPDMEYPENEEGVFAFINQGNRYQYTADNMSAYEKAVTESQNAIKSKMLDSKTLLKVYRVFENNYGSSISFADFLLKNNVLVPDLEDMGEANYGMQTELVSSELTKTSLDLRKNTPMQAMTVPYFDGTGNAPDGSYVGKDRNNSYKDGDIYRVNQDSLYDRPSDDSFRLRERIYGGVVNTKTGEYTTDGTVAVRAFSRYVGDYNYDNVSYLADEDANIEREIYVSNDRRDENDNGKVLVYVGFASESPVGTLVKKPVGTMTLGTKQEELSEDLFGKGTLEYFDTLTLVGEKQLEPFAFDNVGDPEMRVFLDYQGGEVESEELLYGWYGGFFGDARVHYSGSFKNSPCEFDKVYVTGENVAECKLPIPEDNWPDTHNFVGWSTEEGATEPMETIEAKDGLTVYAVWAPNHDHVPVADEKNVVTCTTNGYAGRIICSVCGYVIEEGELIEALGHDYGLTPDNMSGEKTCSRCEHEAKFETQEMGDFVVAVDTTVSSILRTVQYSNGILSIRGAGTVAVKNKNPDTATTDRIEFRPNATAELVLCGVNITTGEDESYSIKIPTEMANDVQIILASGSENTAGSGVIKQNSNGKRLRISSPDNTGKLTATCRYMPAIGGDSHITIESGIIDARSNTTGIGSNGTCSGLIINGGSIYAKGGNNYPGIGGDQRVDGLTINGGDITAIGGNRGAGIGVGANNLSVVMRVKNLIINGGNIYAEGKGYNSAIGGPCSRTGSYNYATCENMQINGGVITANAEDWIAIGARDSHPIIAPTASIKVNKEMSYAVNGDGESVKLVKIENPNGGIITVDGETVPVAWHSDDDTNLYLYLAGDEVVENSSTNASLKYSYTHHVTFVTDGYCEPLGTQTVNNGALIARPENPEFDLDYMLFGVADELGIAELANDIRFEGWFADIDRTVPFDFNAPVTADVEIYAKWTDVDIFTVNFEMNGMGEQVPKQFILNNGIVKEPAAPTAEGYVFDGWYTDEDCTTAYDFSQTVTSDLTLYAKWSIPFPFTDVKAGRYYYEPIVWAVNSGIANGITATTFEPNSPCTRGHVVTFLWRAAGCPEPSSMENPFTDVEEGRFYYKAVLWAVENGITTGVTETTFCPKDPCTRGQIVTFMWRAAGQPEASADNPFTDVKEGKYYIKAVLWAIENGIAKGITATTFEPKTTCTRGQSVTFLYRMYSVI